MNTLRIVHLGKYYPPAPGGIETQTRTLALAQAELGADVRVYCMNHKVGPTVVEHDGPVEITRFKHAASAGKLDVSPELISALRTLKADVLHMQVPNPTMILALMFAGTKIPLVVTYQSDVVRQKLRGALFRPIERLIYRRVRAILPTSPTYVAGSKFLKPYGDQFDVLPNAIDLAPYLNPSPEHRAEADRIKAKYAGGPIWVGCGRQVYYKGFHNAIRALSEVSGTLLLVGDGPDRPALEAEAQRLGLSDRVVFLGNLHYLDVTPYYLAADAFWFPSNARSEAFGIVQLEAMAAGCPVINTAIRHSGVAWVSRHELEGLTVAVDDPSALAAAANRIINEKGLRERLSHAARNRARQDFDHRVIAARSLEIYRDVLQGETKGSSMARPVLAPEP
jgi:glycosyltransferase involved in cell wall biosynthesis